MRIMPTKHENTKGVVGTKGVSQDDNGGVVVSLFALYVRVPSS